MTKTGKLIIVSLCIALLVGVLLLTCLYKPTSYAADTDFSAEKYTNSDKLLNSDGTLSEKTIRSFADEVKAAKQNDIIKDITKVIPLKYLESENAGTVVYTGKEYGFCIYSSGGLLYTMLMDFICKPVDTSVHCDQYRVRIEPILQQCFRRQQSAGEYVWTKQNDDRYEFFVSNPHFWTELANANDRNYGDNGYSKQNDDGIVTSQMRLNCHVAELPDDASATAVAGVHTLDSVMTDYPTTAYVNAKTGNWKAFKDAFDTVVWLGQNVTKKMTIENKKPNDGTIEVNNEERIFTLNPKHWQLDNDELESFYRSAKIKMEGDALLSAKDNCYAEMIVLLNDTNSRSRLTQTCNFDIFCLESKSKNAVKVTVENGQDRFGFYQERTIFDDQAPYFEIGDDFATNDVPVYMLPYGNQRISFTPKYSGEYRFTIPLGVTLSIDGEQGFSLDRDQIIFSLDAGKSYKLELVNRLDVKAFGRLGCTAA